MGQKGNVLWSAEAVTEQPRSLDNWKLFEVSASPYSIVAARFIFGDYQWQIRQSSVARWMAMKRGEELDEFDGDACKGRNWKGSSETTNSDALFTGSQANTHRSSAATSTAKYKAQRRPTRRRVVLDLHHHPPNLFEKSSQS
jgi:hypothetical protein